MNSLYEKSANTDIYARIQDTQMSEREREVALSAIRNAESIVDGCVWASRAVKSVIDKIFHNPADLSHSH